MKCELCKKKNDEILCETCLAFLIWKYDYDLDEVFAHLEQFNGGGKYG